MLSPQAEVTEAPLRVRWSTRKLTSLFEFLSKACQHLRDVFRSVVLYRRASSCRLVVSCEQFSCFFPDAAAQERRAIEFRAQKPTLEEGCLSPHETSQPLLEYRDWRDRPSFIYSIASHISCSSKPETWLPYTGQGLGSTRALDAPQSIESRRWFSKRTSNAQSLQPHCRSEISSAALSL